MLRSPPGSRNQNRRALKGSFPKPLERHIGFAQREGLYGRFERESRGQRQELLTVGTGEVGDRADGALAPEKLVWKLGNVAHVNAGADHPAAGADGGQGRRHQGAHGGEENRGIEKVGRRLIGVACPHRAKLPGEGLGLEITRSGKGEDPAALGAGDLGEEVRGGAKAVEAEIGSLACGTIGAIADEPRAKERRELYGGDLSRQWQAKTRVRERFLGVAAIHRIAGEARVLAEVFLAGLAVAAEPARLREPGNADPVAGTKSADRSTGLSDPANDLVTGGDRIVDVRQLAIEEV